MPVEARVAVVTGGGRGIGRGIVTELASSGLAIVVNYRDDFRSAEAACHEAMARGASAALPFKADVANPEQGQRLLDHVLAAHGKVDIWVNNAGIAPEARLDVLETTPESWDRVIGTNLRGPFFLTQLVARSMIDLAGRGRLIDPQLIFITSVSSTFASVNRAEYCVSKAGSSMVAKLFALRLADHGIQVYEVRPGIIATEMTGPVREVYDRRIADGLSPIRRWGTPADVGKAVAALAGGALPFSTGEVIHVDGGLNLGRL